MAAVIQFVPEVPSQAAAFGAVELSEDVMAQRFETEFSGRVLYAHNRKQWFLYDEARGAWRPDQTDLVLHYVRTFVRGLNARNEARWGKAAVVAAVERLARAHPGIAVSGAEFDADPWLLGTPSGVYDLRTCERLPPSKDHMVTLSTTVAPDLEAPPPLWLHFLQDATGGNAELCDYLQRLAGYALTGDTREESLVFAHGSGGNGKGVFLGTIAAILGDYCKVAAMDAFLETKSDRHPTDLADLAGARLVVASESSEGRRWDEQRVKALTGRDAISARFMRGDFFSFIPQFKLIVASNHKPRIRSGDDAWRRRLQLAPFERKPDTPDPTLKDRLKEEYPAILGWMMQGTEWWLREGLAPPAVVTEATAAYFDEEDLFGIWFREHGIEDKAAVTERKPLYQSYEAWCREMGHRAATAYALTRWLKVRGFGQDMSKASRPILGARLRTDSDGGLF